MGSLLLGLLLHFAAQEDLDSELERLTPKIVADGAGARMAELLKSDAGRLVIKEKIASMVGKAVERIDRDPQAQFERYLFTEDSDGNLSLRPERKREVEAVGREIARRARAWEAFKKAGEQVAAKIPDSAPLGRKLKEFWSNSEFLLALYQKVGADAREPDAEELWNRLIGRSLFRGSDGKLHLRGNYKDQTVAAIAEVKAEFESLERFDKKVTKLLEKLPEDGRARAATAGGRIVLARRLAELANEGTENPVAKLLETGVKEVLDEAAPLAALTEEIRPTLEGVARDLSEDSEHDRNLKKLLKDNRSVLLLAARMRKDLATREENLESAIAAFRDDHFDSDQKGGLSLKKGRFVDDQGKESVDAAVSECDGILNEAAASRAMLAEIAERALDANLGTLLGSREGASAFTELQARVVEDLKQAERDNGLSKFIRAYLANSGDGYRVRPERTARVDEMMGRAKEVQKALDAASREEVGK